MNCGDYKGKIVARVFPNLHKECILGIPWLEYKNPILDKKTSYDPATRLYSYPASCVEATSEAQYQDSQFVQCEANGSMVSLEESGRSVFGVHLTGQG